MLYSYGTNTKIKYRQHGVWDSSSDNIDGRWDDCFEIFTYMGAHFGAKEEEEEEEKKEEEEEEE